MANEKRLIDVTKVISAMQKCLNESPNKKDSVAYFAFESIITALKQEPTVDAVEVVHGRWEYGKWECGHWVKGNERCRCSVCHRDFAVDNSNIWHGCPQCLAKMDGGNEDGKH